MLRRNFFQRIIYTSTVIAAGSLPYMVARMLLPAREQRSINYLRPPGAPDDDKAFINACIGCGACAEICPPRCIRFNKSAGSLEGNTPYINPEIKGCILCNKCIEVCPTSALSEIALEDINMGIARIDRAACYPWVDQGICGACVSICPLGERAIGFMKWNQYQPYIKDGCVGCGLCVEICPEPSLPIRIYKRSTAAIAHHV
jgi:ferredoxin-type protein NapG